MDVKSPAAAGSLPRPITAPPASAEPGRAAVALRHAGIALAGVGVAALTGAACVLSFEDLRGLAVIGEARPDLAYLYPAGFDALLAVAMISVLLLRGGRWPVRLQAGLVLVLLLALAVAAEVATAMRVMVEVRSAAIVVAVAPWVMLAVALWLWLLMIKHAQARRTDLDARLAGEGHGHDIVPFPDAAMPTAEYPRPETLAPGPPGSGAPGPRLPAQPVLDPQAAPPMETVPHHDLPAVPVVGPTPAPETPEVDDLPEPAGARGPAQASRPAEPAGSAVTAAAPETVRPEPAEPVGSPEPVRPSASPQSPLSLESPEPSVPAQAAETAEAAVPASAPVEQPDTPVRWGDLTRPVRGDLLVHPLRPAVPDPERDSWEPGLGQEGRQARESRVSERVETWGAAAGPVTPPADVPGGEETSVTGYGSATQPMRVMTGESPDPAHGSEAADPEEEAQGPQEAWDPQGARDPQEAWDPQEEHSDRRTPYTDDDIAAPPSGRMRSTPLPPED